MLLVLAPVPRADVPGCPVGPVSEVELWNGNGADEKGVLMEDGGEPEGEPKAVPEDGRTPVESAAPDVVFRVGYGAEPK